MDLIPIGVVVSINGRNPLTPFFTSLDLHTPFNLRNYSFLSLFSYNTHELALEFVIVRTWQSFCFCGHRIDFEKRIIGKPFT